MFYVPMGLCAFLVRNLDPGLDLGVLSAELGQWWDAEESSREDMQNEKVSTQSPGKHHFFKGTEGRSAQKPEEEKKAERRSKHNTSGREHSKGSSLTTEQPSSHV